MQLKIHLKVKILSLLNNFNIKSIRMFSFLKKRKINKLPNSKSIAFGLPHVNKVKQMLEKHQYEAILETYNALKNDERTLLLDGISLEENTIDLVFQWYKEQPENWLANLFVGVAYTFVAWKERSSRQAKYVSSSQFRGFRENLEEANKCLSKVITLKPDEAETYARLIRVNMGLSDKANAQNYFRTLVALDANHLGGHLFMANLLAPKWLGSFEEMKTFAEQFRNPQNNDLRYVVYLMFAVQHFVDLSDENEYTAEKIFNHQYKNIILKDYAQFDIPQIDSLQRYHLHNYFSYLFFLLGKNKLRNKEIDLIGEHVAFFPWAYYEVMGARDLQLIKFE